MTDHFTNSSMRPFSNVKDASNAALISASVSCAFAGSGILQ
jgi:hypothetical protein